MAALSRFAKIVMQAVLLWEASAAEEGAFKAHMACEAALEEAEEALAVAEDTVEDTAVVGVVMVVVMEEVVATGQAVVVVPLLRNKLLPTLLPTLQLLVAIRARPSTSEM